MAMRLTDRVIRDLPLPPKGNRKYPDSELPGFNAQITAGGARAFVLRYRIRGVGRQITIGTMPAWSVPAARNRAKELRRMVDQGIDPLAEQDAERAAPTVADLAARYAAEHLPGKRPRSAHDDRSLLRDHVLPALGRLKVATVTRDDVARMHRRITAAGTPIRANRALALVRTMFALAVAWDLRGNNPARGGRGGIALNPEDHRERFLSPAEIARLAGVLDRHPERTPVALIRFLMLTGARFSEAANALWAQFDLVGGTWVKPSSSTKQKKMHRVPLSAPALALLSSLERDGDNPLVFPSPRTGRPLGDINTTWRTIRRDAGLDGVRLHDLRHSFASVLASTGASLQLIGSLLGHAQIQTTMRYAHLSDDARREAVERVGDVITGTGKAAEVVPMPARRR